MSDRSPPPDGDAASLARHAAALVQARRLDAADAVLRTLTRLHPDDVDGWLNHAHLLKTQGRIDAAIGACRRAIALAPHRGLAWWRLADLKATRLDTSDVAAMRAALVGTRSDDDRLHLHFALGKALDDLGDHAGAFEHLRAGNALRLARAPHDADRTSASLRAVAARYAAIAPPAEPAASGPIFIVGMPRSGSSLVEQILASHPLIEGLGELHDLHHIVREIGAHGAAGMSPRALRDLGRRYLDAAGRYRTTERPFFTDKMPSNWLYAGLIPAMLPGARILDVRRHPMACGFANYAQHYSRGNDFAYDLHAIGRFYVGYVQHMATIERTAPTAVHRVHHEALVDAPERAIRRLLDDLGLPFDPTCLRFHETARAVYTPSADQVRRPINRDGLDRWRAYEVWLEPLREALGPVLMRYPAVTSSD